MSAVVIAILSALLFLTWTPSGALDSSGPYGSQLNPMGFHEGARRVIKCDGGYIKGFDAYASHLGGFAEPTLNALRVVCSSSRILLEYETGSLPDTLVFGNLPPEVQPIKVECPSGTGVAALDWRRVFGTEKDNTARVAGFRVHCGTEQSSQPIVADSKTNQAYPASLKCSGTKDAPQGVPLKLTAIELWYEQLVSGIHLISCTQSMQ